MPYLPIHLILTNTWGLLFFRLWMAVKLSKLRQHLRIGS